MNARTIRRILSPLGKSRRGLTHDQRSELAERLSRADRLDDLDAFVLDGEWRRRRRRVPARLSE